MDPNDLDNYALRKALEFVAANQATITKAQEVATSSTSQVLVKEAERQRAQVIRTLESAVNEASRSPADAIARQRAQQIAYLKRAVEPLSVGRLARQMAGILASDTSIGAKVVATEIIREQAELQRKREERLHANPATARRLVEEARKTLSLAGISLEELDWSLPEIDEEDVETASGQLEDQELPEGLQALVLVIHENPDSAWRKNLELAIAIAALLVSLASLYVALSVPPAVVPSAPDQSPHLRSDVQGSPTGQKPVHDQGHGPHR